MAWHCAQALSGPDRASPAAPAQALAKLGHHPGALLGSLCREVSIKLREFNAQNLANTLWAVSTLGGRQLGLPSCLPAARCLRA